MVSRLGSSSPLVPRRVAAGMIVGLLAVVPPAWAAPAAKPDRQMIRDTIREYLLENPEILEEAQEVLTQRRAAARASAEQQIEAHKAQLFADPADPIAGNPAGDVTIVEFFDFQCSHCRVLDPALAELVRRDGGVRIVYKDYPILDQNSVLAARAALAAARHGQYAQAHAALLAAEPPLTAEVITEALSRAGLDAAAIVAEARAESTLVPLRATRALAQSLGLDGTPAMVIGRTLVVGSRDVETLAALVAEARRTTAKP